MPDDMVPKSDLIALKEGQTKALGELTRTHEAAVTSLGEEHTSAVEGLNTQIRTGTEELGRARATVSELEEKGKTHETTVVELTASKKDLKTAQDSLKAVQDSLAGDLRKTLIGQYKIKEEAVKDKTVAELTTIRDALSGRSGPNSKDYTAGGGGGGPGEKTTGRQKIKQGLDDGDLRAS